MLTRAGSRWAVAFALSMAMAGGMASWSVGPVHFGGRAEAFVQCHPLSVEDNENFIDDDADDLIDCQDHECWRVPPCLAQ